MKTILAVTAVMVALGAPVRADGDAAKLLALADGFRGGFDSGIVEVKLTNYEVDRVVEEAGFEVSVKGENCLVRVLSVRS